MQEVVPVLAAEAAAMIQYNSYMGPTSCVGRFWSKLLFLVRLVRAAVCTTRQEGSTSDRFSMCHLRNQIVPSTFDHPVI